MNSNSGSLAISGFPPASPAEHLHIALASDERGAEGVLVAAYSAIRRASRPVQVWIIEDGMQPGTQRQLVENWRKLPKFAGAVFHSLRKLPLKFPSWWSHGRWPMSSCARFQLAEILPAGVNRCLYLDYDTITGTDIAELMDMDLKGQPVAMVPNFRMAEEVCGYVRTMGLDPEAYCNAGVMVIDVETWRQEHLAAALIEHGSAMSPQIWFFDQDMLNSFFRGRCLLLEERWNLRDAAADVQGNIIHFAGAAKPWNVARSGAVRGYVAWQDERDGLDFQQDIAAKQDSLKYRWSSMRARIHRKLIAIARGKSR